MLDPSSQGASQLMGEQGYSLEVVDYEDNRPLWQLRKGETVFFAKPRKIEFVIVISSESYPISLNDINHKVIGRTGMALVRKRFEQQKFSSDVNGLYNGKCIITNAKKRKGSQYIHACHISDERDEDRNFKDNSSSNGILLRADLHALFDEELLTIDGNDGTVTFANEALQLLYPEYHDKPCKSWSLVSAETR